MRASQAKLDQLDQAVDTLLAYGHTVATLAHFADWWYTAYLGSKQGSGPPHLSQVIDHIDAALLQGTKPRERPPEGPAPRHLTAEEEEQLAKEKVNPVVVNFAKAAQKERGGLND
ncbi:MAG: hypothetical protein H0T73_08245 [Ardenticatenales bacterium]|nr:hypothetical protein [Ardenticatenales bacterium]